jgi:hypothetical protein
VVICGVSAFLLLIDGCQLTGFNVPHTHILERTVSPAARLCCRPSAQITAGTVGYCVGNLRIADYALPWESADFAYPANLAAPLQIEIEASDGASDYGNKFGEPVVQVRLCSQMI